MKKNLQKRYCKECDLTFMGMGSEECPECETPFKEEQCKNPMCERKLPKDNKDGFCHNEHCEYKFKEEQITSKKLKKMGFPNIAKAMDRLDKEEQISDWEIEFEKKFQKQGIPRGILKYENTGGVDFTGDVIIDFIKQTLAKQKQDLVEKIKEINNEYWKTSAYDRHEYSHASNDIINMLK